MADSWYESDKTLSTEFSGDLHRQVVGGLWEELGDLQFDFMLARGLKPQHRLHDIGCGALRGGRKFIAYLEPGNYFGSDINQKLIQRGIDTELTEELRARISARSFAVAGDFNFDFPVERFDFGIAVSLFTHLSETSIRNALERLRPSFEGGRLFATCFVGDADVSVEQAAGITTHHDRDPYHFAVDHIVELGQACGWAVNWIGDFGHPRNQQMVEFAAMSSG